jgi:GT2 family glycosyltransferase
MQPADLDIAVASVSGSRVLEFATDLAAELNLIERRASVVVDRAPPLLTGRLSCLLVPHRAFDDWAVDHPEGVATRLRRTVAICTGQVDLDTALALRAARGVLALAPGAEHACRLAGIDVRPLPLGWRGTVDEGARRDLDLVICEGWTADRWRVLARCARVLDGRSADLRASYVGGSRAGVEHLPDADGRRALLRRARVALIVGSGHPLDLLAAVEAAACGAVIVTDARIDLGPFSPGVHLVRADERALPAVLDALLRDPERITAIRLAAASLVRSLPLSRAAEAVADVADAGSAPVRRMSLVPEPDAEKAPPDPTGRQPAAVAATVAEVRRLGRRVDRLESLSAGAAAPDPAIRYSPSWDSAAPEMTVVIPLHDYEGYVEAACRSVLDARAVRAELIVVDDASTDRGADRVESLFAGTPDVPSALVRLDRNVGIAEARNRGAALARSPLLLFLDADDELLPHGPALLRDALRDDPGAAFAYGLLAVEGPEGPRAILNAEPWNPDLLRDGNYINALALVRLDAYRRIGGYRADGLLELGWEDYDFWLRMAEADLAGAHVRQFVARYRAHGESRTMTADTIAVELMSYLRTRHPRILDERTA